MAKKKYYAVGVGRETGVFETWAECQASTSGYPGAKFKSFDNRSDAEEFVKQYVNSGQKSNDEFVDYDDLVAADLKNGRVVAFTDGSYTGKTEEAGYGIYILVDGQKPVEISDKVHTKKFISTNNIAPEVFAVLEALKWVVSNEFDKVTIYHDLELVGNWADGSNKANGEIGKLFLRELNEKYRTILDIKFVWVKGHDGIEYNEKADRLAANAIKNRKPVGKYGANSFYGIGVSKDKVFEIIDIFKMKEDVSFNESGVPGGHKFQFKKNKEKLTVTYFESSQATWLQGEVNSMFSEFLSFYTENIPMFEMIKAYSDSYKETIQIKEVDAFIENLSLPLDYPRSAVTLLQQSYLMRKLNREEIDYSHYTSSAYRALEGHLKYLCMSAGVPVDRYTLKKQFRKERDENGRKVLSNQILANHSFHQRIEDAYNVVYLKRHPISHFGDMIVNGFDDTLLIPNLQEAHDRIDEVFNLIKF